jgi:hypothetical protein
VKIDVPLLPIVLEARWRPLPTFRPRITLVGLMLAVVVAAAFFSLAARSVRLRTAGSFHAVKASEENALNHRQHKSLAPVVPTPLETWHASMSHRHHDAASRVEWHMGIIVKLLLAWGLVAVSGRALHWLRGRWVSPRKD